MNTKRSLISQWMVLPALALVVGACAQVEAAPPAATLEPSRMATAVLATAAPPAAEPTQVPPTATPSPSPVPPTDTPEPPPDLDATAAAEEAAAVAAQIANIDDDLHQYGLSTETGRLGWVHDAYSVEVTEYLEEDFHTDYPDVVAADFVIQADITWNTTSGVAGCGLAVRADPDFDHGDSYRLYLIRLGPLWDIEYYKAGDFFTNLTSFRDALPVDDGLDSTNKVAVVVQGSQLSIFANGHEMDTISDTRLKNGTAAFITWQESGTTTCTFENGWMWILDE